ncbi:hypothetical protein [Candidatus Sulfurimonas baltica]|uniref:Hydrogenase maturation protease n=1 Tax=Candidatus Sulfurimonas baltica TaxID=2740404 RepID=A0A7S7LWP0_9BACT|nr:hypothetical protein [Candidatus Sulfurimonas baltica]QOY52914.1 hypothetical protein HUE88_04300 [Candidatus Sulfurimonas baltica]
MRAIVGFGNELRGEDAFGVDVVNLLQKLSLKDTKLITLFQLTPELCMDLLDADEVVFIDAAFCEDNQYALACSIQNQTSLTLSHHISINTIKEMLNILYNHYPKIEVFSMLTCSFDEIKNRDLYECRLNEIVKFISTKNSIYK